MTKFKKFKRGTLNYSSPDKIKMNTKKNHNAINFKASISAKKK